MIKIENAEVLGWEHAIRGMRNPMNSWARSDSHECDCGEYAAVRVLGDTAYKVFCPMYKADHKPAKLCGGEAKRDFCIGENDHALMMRLAKAGPEHAKYRRMIVVYADVTAPLYWWKEYDTFKVGTVANSCSTMHKVTAKQFDLQDFSHEHLTIASSVALQEVIYHLNYWWAKYDTAETDEIKKRMLVADHPDAAEQLQPAAHGDAELRGAGQHLPPAPQPQIGRVAGVLQVD